MKSVIVEEFKAEVLKKCTELSDERLKEFLEWGRNSNMSENAKQEFIEVVRKEIYRRMTKEIRYITGYMKTGKYWGQINALRNCDARHDSWFKLIDIFNYGYMMGKRDERAKKKALN